MSSWWERYPEALERERSELDALGWAWEVDTAAREAGTLAVRVETPSGEGTRRLTAEYPASYPYFPPQVIADLGTFERHQNPVAGTLCLLAREGEEWVPGHDTLAGLLRQQLQDIEEVNRPGVDPEEVAALEDHAAEPLSMFLQYERRSVVLVPDETPPPGVPGGRLELDRLQSAASAENPSPVRAIFRRATDMTGQELVRFDIEVPNRLDPIEGYWIRLLQRPMFSRPDELQSQLLRLAESQNAAFAKAMGRAQKGKVLIVGFVYPDEQSWRQTRDDWLFIALRITVSQKKARRASGVPALLRTDWAGRETLIQRAPYLRPLRDKSALVVGLGTLGSPLALQLARAGLGQLHLLDSDLLQVGNTIRWGTGWEFAGEAKISALCWRLKSDHPYTKVLTHHCRIGQEAGDYELLQSLIQSADIVIDATAAHRVSHFLSDLCWELRRPYVWLTTTPGSAGGVVGRVLPGATSCWHCFQRAMTNGQVRVPADAGTTDVQPGGCSQPTFVGSGLDSDEIALLASRLSVGTLCRGSESAYPDFDWNGAVVDLLRNGRSIAPEWTTYSWAPDPNCRCQRR